jgi:hypothetical protein
MSKRDRIFVGLLACLLAVAGFWFLALKPKRADSATAAARAAEAQTKLQAATDALATATTARASFETDYATVARLGKAVPADDDVRSLMVQINAAADRSGVDFRTINVGGGEGAPSTGPGATAPSAGPTPPGASAVGSAGFSTMPFSFNFNGKFMELGKFFSRLDRFVAVKPNGLDVTGRLLLLNSITVTPDTTKGFPALNAEVKASSYLLPSTETATAGATAAGPAAAGSAPSDGTTPTAPATTTTATISGATR